MALFLAYSPIKYINCFDKNILSITITSSSSSSSLLSSLRHLGYHDRDNGRHRGSHDARRLYATVASRASSTTDVNSSSRRVDADTDVDPLMTAKAMSKSQIIYIHIMQHHVKLSID
jgi:hypothetical protein